jgi:SAM-dependent methyltransferase
MTPESDTTFTSTHEERYTLFKKVYDHNLWGASKNGRKYYSDSPAELTLPYRTYVSEFISNHEDITRVVDLGCGDFEASSGIDMGDAHYIGVDIYDELIRYNQEHYGSARREFRVCDLIEDALPPGDLCLVTMVLYIMSHEDVFPILEKLKKYRYVLVTDGQADIEPSAHCNINKKTDKYTRRDYYNNGFYLELPPFNLNLKVVHEYALPSGELVRTVLLEHI